MTADELTALWEEHIRHEFDTKNTDPTGSTVPGVPGLPVALEPPRRG